MFKICMLKTIKYWWKIQGQYKWRDIPWAWIGGFNKIKMPVLPKVIYKFNAVKLKQWKAQQNFAHTKLLYTAYCYYRQQESLKLYSKFYIKGNNEIAKTILRKR